MTDETAQTEEPKTGFVAFLDLLGFSKLVARDGFGDKVNRYFAVVRESIAGHPPQPEFTVASDSTILTTGDSLGDLQALLGSVAEITHRSLVDLDLPIRGGIAFGSYRREAVGEAGTLVAGRGVVEAYELEQSQDWIGVTLAPGIIAESPALQRAFSFTPSISSEQHAEARRAEGHAGWVMLAAQYDTIPADDRLSIEGERRGLDGYVIVPHLHESLGNRDQILAQLAAYYGKLVELRPGAPNGRAQGKYGRSMGFIGQIRGQFASLSSNTKYWAMFTRGGAPTQLV